MRIALITIVLITMIPEKKDRRRFSGADVYGMLGSTGGFAEAGIPGSLSCSPVIVSVSGNIVNADSCD